MMTILIEVNSNIGDAVMNLPILHYLVQSYPNCSIDLICDAKSYDLFLDYPNIRHIYIKKKVFSFKAKLFLSLLKNHYDLAIGLRSDAVPLLIRANKKIYKNERDAALFGKVSELLYNYSCLKKYFPNATESTIQTPIFLSDQTRQEAKAFLNTLPKGALLAVAPGANNSGKMWSKKNFIELLLHIRSDFSAMILLGSPGEKEVCQEIADQTGAYNLAGQTSLRQTAGVLEHCQLFIGNDSGIGHIASAQGVPTLAIFAHQDITQADPVRYTPYRQHSLYRTSNDQPLITVGDVLAKLQTL